MELSVVPVFQSEIVPAPIRGMAVGSYQFSLMVRLLYLSTKTVADKLAWDLTHHLHLQGNQYLARQ